MSYACDVNLAMLWKEYQHAMTEDVIETDVSGMNEENFRQLWQLTH